MGIAESKIETTDRLRRQGKWEEASRFKDQAKQRHRDAGKSRQEANRLAWEAVQEKFPPVPPEAEELLNRVMAVRHPPRGQDGEDDDELQFQKVWFAHHMVRVLMQYFHIPDANKRWACCLITECLLENAPDPNSYVLVIMSILDPGEFSKHMGETLTKRIIRTKGTDERSVALRAELGCILHRLDSAVTMTAEGVD